MVLEEGRRRYVARPLAMLGLSAANALIVEIDGDHGRSFALMLKWMTSCTAMWEPSVPLSWNVLVSCSTSFLLLTDAPCHSAKWPVAVTPFGSSGVNVAVPSAVVVSQNPVPVAKVSCGTPRCARSR